MKLHLHKNLRKILLEIRYRYLRWVLPADPGPESSIMPIPPIMGEFPTGPQDRTCIFAACDNGYYGRYAKAFIGSIVNHAPGHPIHVHVINPSTDTLSELEELRAALSNNPLSFSWEKINLDHTEGEETGIYYYTMRFLRLSEFTLATGIPCLCLDIDALLSNAADENFFNQLKNSDIAFLSRFNKFGRNTKLLAGTLFINNTPAGAAYIADVGQEIYRFISAGKLLEKMDQLILYSRYLFARKRYSNLTFMDLAYPVIDLDFTAQGMIWYPKGKSKNEANYVAREQSYTRQMESLLKPKNKIQA